MVVEGRGVGFCWVHQVAGNASRQGLQGPEGYSICWPERRGHCHAVRAQQLDSPNRWSRENGMTRPSPGASRGQHHSAIYAKRTGCSAELARHTVLWRLSLGMVGHSVQCFYVCLKGPGSSDELVIRHNMLQGPSLKIAGHDAQYIYVCWKVRVLREWTGGDTMYCKAIKNHSVFAMWAELPKLIMS